MGKRVRGFFSGVWLVVLVLVTAGLFLVCAAGIVWVFWGDAKGILGLITLVGLAVIFTGVVGRINRV